MSKNMPRILIALSILALISGAILFLTTRQNDSLLIGDSPSYTRLWSCSDTARFVIDKKKLPENLIHSCQTDKYAVDNETIYVTEIAYGEAGDCPSGCIYEYLLVAVPENRSSISSLPGYISSRYNDLLQRAPLPQMPLLTEVDKLKCPDVHNLDSITTRTLAKRNGLVGWQFSFTKPYACSWQEYKSRRETDGGNFEYIVDKVNRSWNGSIFVSLKNPTLDGGWRNNLQWNFNALQSKEDSREEIVVAKP